MEFILILIHKGNADNLRKKMRNGHIHIESHVALYLKVCMICIHNSEHHTPGHI